MNFRDRWEENEQGERFVFTVEMQRRLSQAGLPIEPCLLYTSDAADERSSVDLGGRRIINKKTQVATQWCEQDHTKRYVQNREYERKSKNYG